MQKQPNEIGFSLEAEAGVLGAMIIEPECIGKLAARLHPDAFYLEIHSYLYEKIASIYLDAGDVDMVLVRDAVKNDGKLEWIGGAKYLAELTDSVPATANVLYYANIVLDKAAERSLIDVAKDISVIAGEPGPINEKIQDVQDRALELQPLHKGPEFLELKRELPRVIASMGDNEGLIETGFKELNKILHGFLPGEMCVIAARPAMGKSALAAQMALSMAKAGVSVFFVPLEMTADALMERMACNEACVNNQDIRKGFAPPGDVELLNEAVQKLQGYNIIFSRLGKGQTPEQVEGMTRTLKRTHDIQVIFIDYLQLMSVGRRVESIRQEVTEISRKLKLLAIRENIVVIALSQMNPEIENRANHMPRLADLRESGSIEQDADVVIMLNREDGYHKGDPDYSTTGKVDLFVHKNRRGPEGMVSLAFVPEYVKFASIISEDAVNEPQLSR